MFPRTVAPLIALLELVSVTPTVNVSTSPRWAELLPKRRVRDSGFFELLVLITAGDFERVLLSWRLWLGMGTFRVVLILPFA